jgi:hypothetical protein
MEATRPAGAGLLPAKRTKAKVKAKPPAKMKARGQKR